MHIERARALQSLRERGGGIPRGLALADILERLLHAHGYLAGYNTTAAWARRQGLAISRNKNTTQAFASRRDRPGAQGKWTPPGILPARLRPALPEQVNHEEPEHAPDRAARSPRKYRPRDQGRAPDRGPPCSRARHPTTRATKAPHAGQGRPRDSRVGCSRQHARAAGSTGGRWIREAIDSHASVDASARGARVNGDRNRRQITRY